MARSPAHLPEDSEIMAYFIIAVVLLMIIGPILAILPSKRQKDQMQKRKTAMAAGISVHLTRIDDPDPDPEAYLSNTGRPLERVMSVIAYRLPRPRSEARQIAFDWALERKVRQSTTAAEGLPSGWQWVDTQTVQLPVALRQYLQGSVAQLPNDVVRVEERKNIVSAYWNERGDATDLARLIDFMRGCVAVPLALQAVDSASNHDH